MLKVAFALPMSKEDRATFAELAGGREPPKRRVKELVVVAGRRARKDSVAAAIVTWIAVIERGHVGRLSPGERATVTLIACDREQARIVREYSGSYFAAIPEFASPVELETTASLEQTNGVEIVVVTNSYRRSSEVPRVTLRG